MKKILLSICALAAVGNVVNLRAEEGKPAQKSESAAPSAFSWDTIKTRLMHLKDGLMSSAVERHYQNKSASAVAAVRGAKQTQFNADQPYWKGGVQAKKSRELKAERAELSAAVDLLLAGKTEEGTKKLNEFESKHPKSPLMKDVKETREMLKQAPPQDTSAAPDPKDGK